MSQSKPCKIIIRGFPVLCVKHDRTWWVSKLQITTLLGLEKRASFDYLKKLEYITSSYVKGINKILPKNGRMIKLDDAYNLLRRTVQLDKIREQAKDTTFISLTNRVDKLPMAEFTVPSKIANLPEVENQYGYDVVDNDIEEIVEESNVVPTELALSETVPFRKARPTVVLKPTPTKKTKTREVKTPSTDDNLAQRYEELKSIIKIQEKLTKWNLTLAQLKASHNL